MCTSNCEHFEHSRNLGLYFTVKKVVLIFIQNHLQQVALLSLADSSVLWLWSNSNSRKELLWNTQEHSCSTSWQLLKAATPFPGTERLSSAVAAQSQENTCLVQGVANIWYVCIHAYSKATFPFQFKMLHSSISHNCVILEY